MQKLFVFTAVVAVLLVGAGCKSKSKDIMPLTVGNAWTYEGYMLQSTDTVATTTMNVKVEKTATLTSGESVFEMSTTSAMHLRTPDTTITTTSTSYAREAGDAILSYTSLSDSTGDTVIMTDLSVGKKWTSGSGTDEVIAQENVTVGAGTYSDAWKIKGTISGDVMYEWFAPGVGLVKTDGTSEEQDVTYTIHSELTEVTIK